VSPTIRDIVVALVTGLCVLGGQYFLAREQGESAYDRARIAEIEALYLQVAKMRAVQQEQSARIVALETENALLKLRLDKEFAVSPRGVLQSFLNSIDSPAWCKQAVRSDDEPVQFLMWTVNDSYEDYYDVSPERYIGLTDYDIHPPAVAETYYKNDVDVLVKRKFVLFTELVPLPGGGRGPRDFWKFWYLLPDGTELVCGMQLEA